MYPKGRIVATKRELERRVAELEERLEAIYEELRELLRLEPEKDMRPQEKKE